MYNNHILQKQSGLLDRCIDAFCCTIVLIVVLSIMLGLHPVYIASGSMAPTLPTGSICIARDIDAESRLPERGDIVLFYPEAGSDTLFAKRVIGLPGDTLWAEDDVLTINGEYYDTIPGTGDWIADVPDGCVFFLGDNRGNSCDSRYFGCIALEQLTTKILFSLPFS